MGDILRRPALFPHLKLHIEACERAIADGVSLGGYIFWSLLNNFEWTLGNEKRFALVHVDFNTLKLAQNFLPRIEVCVDDVVEVLGH